MISDLTGPPALELIGVRAGYGRIEVLHGIDLVVPCRSVVAMLGPNGAGKTTTLNVISGQVVPTDGCVHIAGRHVNGAAPHEIAGGGVCTIPDGRGIFPNLTVRDNLKVWSFSTSRSVGKVEEAVYAAFPRLQERRRQIAGTLSGGEQQMLAIARAIVADAGLLLLDEISMGLAPLVVSELYELVGDLARSGYSVLLVEQFAQTALEVADYVAVVVGGRITAFGEPADVEDRLTAAYLGGAA
ncbi:ABC transporter ATP-binding protein [Humibacter sp.]|uniref:ABC transporter ATP-binding protein n=1 Tax=Humibacter sp. TaxID=1940291 RepID=UPI002CEE4B24|nr:ABC transporter ATP-binding protein [Humibacter sp.]HVX09183.1 ABC transporter ATP-binding protein [Humibacter sp.]